MGKSRRRKRAVNAAIKQASKAHVLAVQGLRSSGAAGTHADKRTKRNRTRATQKATAIGEQL